ncbi:MAG: hypothetical protein IT561_00830 [Alphaproteobacteria bacterium]|nr:hypothetical protein [Alphaproteobacteria bacterium]
MATFTATAPTDMAAGTGLYPFELPFAVTRSANAIQISTPAGGIQLIGGSFAYDAGGALTGGTITSIEVPSSYSLDGLALGYATYAVLLKTGGALAARGALLGGDDAIAGSQAGDRLLGFDGDDTIAGGFGNDDINGNRGDDDVSGDDGADTVMGGQGADHVRGDAGDDLVAGSRGNDTVDGGAGADLVYGGQENDVLIGGDGADRLSGDLGDDVLYGQLGADTFYFGPGSGRDAIEGFAPIEEGDRIAVPRHVNGTDIETPADVAARVGLHPDGQLLDLGNHNVVLIRGYFGGDVSADHFIVI